MLSMRYKCALVTMKMIQRKNSSWYNRTVKNRQKKKRLETKDCHVLPQLILNKPKQPLPPPFFHPSITTTYPPNPKPSCTSGSWLGAPDSAPAVNVQLWGWVGAPSACWALAAPRPGCRCQPAHASPTVWPRCAPACCACWSKDAAAPWSTRTCHSERSWWAGLRSGPQVLMAVWSLRPPWSGWSEWTHGRWRTACRGLPTAAVLAAGVGRNSRPGAPPPAPRPSFLHRCKTWWVLQICLGLESGQRCVASVSGCWSDTRPQQASLLLCAVTRLTGVSGARGRCCGAQPAVRPG